MASSDPALLHSFQLLPAEQFLAVAGANLGHPIGHPDTLCPDDAYRLQPAAAMIEATLSRPTQTGRILRREDNCRMVESLVQFEAVLTFIGPDATAVDAIVLAEQLSSGARRFLLPLGGIHPRADYTLIAVDQNKAGARFADLARTSFVRGTRISLATGQMVAVEDLKRGDRIMTRNNGAQKLRWIGQMTERAHGINAPVHIAAGVMNNDRPLVVSPNHRLFVYQREDVLGLGRHEVLIRAGDIVDGHSITRAEGGFVDYFQLLFDAHEVVYAEGIACQTLQSGPDISTAMPEQIRDMMSPRRRSPRPMTVPLRVNAEGKFVATLKEASR